MSPRAPSSPDRSCQEPVSTARRHEQFADVYKLSETENPLSSTYRLELTNYNNLIYIS